jgi:hypothetical protein
MRAQQPDGRPRLSQPRGERGDARGRERRRRWENRLTGGCGSAGLAASVAMRAAGNAAGDRENRLTGGCGSAGLAASVATRAAGNAAGDGRTA